MLAGKAAMKRGRSTNCAVKACLLFSSSVAQPSHAGHFASASLNGFK